jgi:hypothetical protein
MAYSKKQKSHTHRRSKSRSKRRSQKGGAIITPAMYSNSNNAHFSGIGFTDPTGAVTGCTGSTSSPSALKGSDIYTTIGGIKTPVSMKGGRRYKRSCTKCNRQKCVCKNKSRMRRTQRGGRNVDTNGYSIGGVHLKPSLSGIANNYHTAYNSCEKYTH